MIIGVMGAQPISVQPADIYPAISGSQATTPASGTSHSIAVTASTGQRSFVFLSVSSQVEPIFPAGWTTIVNQLPTGAWGKVAYRDFVAGDTASITVTTASSVGIMAHAVKIGAGTFDPAVAPIYNSSSLGSSATIDPFSLTDPSGARPKLAFAWAASDGAATLVSMPANMTFTLSNVRGTPNCSSHIARAETNLSAFNPDAFTLSAAQFSSVATIFVIGFVA